MNPEIEMNLEGKWKFIPENGNETEIIVPGGGWLKQGFDCEAGTYERLIAIPDLGKTQVTRLELGAVNHIAEYYIGKDEASLVKIYEDVTAFTAQTVDLTPYVKPGEVYLLRIFVRAYKDGRPVAPHWAEWCECIARGIFRGAWLRIYPDIFISDTFIKTSVASRTFKYEAWITNCSGGDKSVRLDGRLGSWNGDDWNYPSIPEINAVIGNGETVKVESRPVPWNLGDESYWWPNIPYREGYVSRLHELKLELFIDNQAYHSAKTRFGFRELRQSGGFFVLNGARINFRGDNLQVANYDRVDFNGKGDAIDTLPGFLPPSGSNPGWPKAVDNFLRLNYNVQREHMGPWTDYMIDVCDEMGLMLIGESACRWNGFDMENDRGFHEVKCLKDIVRWHKNHPSIIRWSTKNEAQCTDPDYHLELYEAIKEIDDTRPIFEDFLTGDRESFNPDIIFSKLLDREDFTWMEHYLSYDKQGVPHFTTINLNDAVVCMTNRPYGLTEADWMRSSTPGGLAYFAVTTALVRGQGGSDVRPYTLLSSWVSCVPGVRTADILTEENRHPVYGEDNAPDPWSLSGIQLLRKSCSPLFAMDYDFWWLNRLCDAWGHFPVSSPQVMACSDITREITVFNDDLRGEAMELVWELREGSTANWIADMGRIRLNIRPGYSEKVPVTFKAPKFNTFLFLTLKLVKDGIERFCDDLTCYEVVEGLNFASEFNGEERKFK